jgi:hypothetical protein
MLMQNNRGREARLHYMAGTFRVLTNGDFVTCAATGRPIPLDDLRYWSVERQEPYATAEAAVEAAKRGR